MKKMRTRYKFIGLTCLIWLGLWLYGLQYNVFVNAKANELFGENYCWLIRNKNSNFGLLNITQDKNLDVPMLSNIWNYVLPYWRVGSQPIHFGLIDVNAQDYDYPIYGWSYRKKQFWEARSVYISGRQKLVTSCKEMLKIS